jgi:flagellar biosynthesis GTPase FlhF
LLNQLKTQKSNLLKSNFMNLKRYRVNNIKEALKFIKRDLGPDALIVSTRQVKEGKGAFGMFGKTMLEVTAAAGEKKKNSAAPKVEVTKALEAYGGGTDAAENALADTFKTSEIFCAFGCRSNTEHDAADTKRTAGNSTDLRRFKLTVKFF